MNGSGRPRHHVHRVKAEVEHRGHAPTRLYRSLQENRTAVRTEQVPDRPTLIIRTRFQPPQHGVVPEVVPALMHDTRPPHSTLPAPSVLVHHEGDHPAGELWARRGVCDETGAACPVVLQEALRRDLTITGVTTESGVRSVLHTPNPQEYGTDIAVCLQGSGTRPPPAAEQAEQDGVYARAGAGHPVRAPGIPMTVPPGDARTGAAQQTLATSPSRGLGSRRSRSCAVI